MPNATNNKKGEQWDICQRCGRQFPLSRFKWQSGFLICDSACCWDNQEVERREQEIAHVLGVNAEGEGGDTRYIDNAFFVTQDDEVD